MHIMDMDMVAAIPAASKVLLIHGSGDVTVPPYNAQRLAPNIKNNEIRFLKGADHFYSKGHKQGIVEMLKAYFEEMYSGAKCPKPVDSSLYEIDVGFVAPDPDVDGDDAAKARL